MQLSHLSCSCGLEVPSFLFGEYDGRLLGLSLFCGLLELERFAVLCFRPLLILSPDCDLRLAVVCVLYLGLVEVCDVFRLLLGDTEMGNRVALTRAIADFSSATIRLCRLSSNSLLGTSVMSLYLADPIRSL